MISGFQVLYKNRPSTQSMLEPYLTTADSTCLSIATISDQRRFHRIGRIHSNIYHRDVFWLHIETRNASSTTDIHKGCQQWLACVLLSRALRTHRSSRLPVSGIIRRAQQGDAGGHPPVSHHHTGSTGADGMPTRPQLTRSAPSTESLPGHDGATAEYDDLVKADSWSLGCVIYAMLIGRLPFSDDYELRLAFRILRGRWEIPSSSQCTPEAIEVLSNCLKFRVSQRWNVSQVIKSPWMTMNSEHAVEKTTSLNPTLVHINNHNDDAHTQFHRVSPQDQCIPTISKTQNYPENTHKNILRR